MRIIVVGGGISGLTAAHTAALGGHDVTCIDAGGAPGGLIRSERHDGFLCEAGPQALLDGVPEAAALIASVGLTDRALGAEPAAKRRFIYARGGLHVLPMSPPALLRSRLLSPLGKLRLLLEPLLPRRRVAAGDDGETVLAFGNRRLGREATRTLLATAVIGIYATEASALSLASALPRIAAMEREHGSLLRAVLAGRKQGRRPGKPLSFPDGLAELPAAIARALGPRLVTARADGIAPTIPGTGAGTGNVWRVALAGGRTLEAESVVLATDAATTASLLRELAPEAAAAIAGIATTPAVICCLGFRDAGKRPLGMDLAGYGFLVARGQAPKLLGCQYETSTFAGRAPEDAVLLRAILGGAGEGFDPGVIDKTDDQIAATAVADLRTVAGLQRGPDLVRVWRHPQGIPQIRPGHAGLVAAVDAALGRLPGLHVIGHALRGVGVNESIKAGTAAAAAAATARPR